MQGLIPLHLVCNSFKRPLTLILDIHLTYQHFLTSQNTGKSQLLEEQRGHKEGTEKTRRRHTQKCHQPPIKPGSDQTNQVKHRTHEATQTHGCVTILRSCWSRLSRTKQHRDDDAPIHAVTPQNRTEETL